MSKGNLLGAFMCGTGRRIMTAFVAVSAIAAVAGSSARAEDIPTPEEYAAHVGGDATIIAPGALKLDNQSMVCGQRPTVLDSQLDDYGAAYPGFLILNPRLIAKVSTTVKLWIFAHECGHQFRGPDEERADCFAVQRGRRQKWLTVEGLEQICEFIRPSRGDSAHFGGPYRCEAMKRCYASPEVE